MYIHPACLKRQAYRRGVPLALAISPNAYAGRWMVSAGVAMAAAAVAFGWLSRDDAPDRTGAYALTCSGLMLAGVVVMVVRCFRYLGTLDE
jgi:hypothetical protein